MAKQQRKAGAAKLVALVAIGTVLHDGETYLDGESLTVDAATEHFWTQAKEGLLCTRRCTSCGEVHWYPRALCPFCMGDTEWCSLSGLGTISPARTKRVPRCASCLADQTTCIPFPLFLRGCA